MIVLAEQWGRVQQCCQETSRCKILPVYWLDILHHVFLFVVPVLAFCFPSVPIFYLPPQYMYVYYVYSSVQRLKLWNISQSMARFQDISVQNMMQLFQPRRWHSKITVSMGIIWIYSMQLYFWTFCNSSINNHLCICNNCCHSLSLRLLWVKQVIYWYAFQKVINVILIFLIWTSRKWHQVGQLEKLQLL